LRICRALLRVYLALLRMHSALLRMHRDLLHMCKAFLRIYQGIFAYLPSPLAQLLLQIKEEGTALRMYWAFVRIYRAPLRSLRRK